MKQGGRGTFTDFQGTDCGLDDGSREPRGFKTLLSRDTVQWEQLRDCKVCLYVGSNMKESFVHSGISISFDHLCSKLV